MAQQKIEFRKVRDFGENLNDTVSFIRLNFKPMMGSFFAICGTFMLAFALYSSVYQSKVFVLLNKLRHGSTVGSNSFADILDANYFITLMLGLLTYIAMKVAFNAYIKFQLEHDNKFPALDEVWIIFKKYFFRVLLYSLMVWFIIAFFTGFIAFLITLSLRTLISSGSFLLPFMLVMLVFVGVTYLFTVFVPFDAIVMLEDANFNKAFSRCFELIKGKFLSSFGIYCTAYIIYVICGGLVSIFSTGIPALVSYFTTEKIDSSVQMATSFINIFTYIFFIVFLVSSTFHYFTLAEIKDGTGILHRINKIGQDSNNFDNIEEQY